MEWRSPGVQGREAHASGLLAGHASAAPAQRRLREFGIVGNQAGWNRRRKAATTFGSAASKLDPVHHGRWSASMHVRHAAVAAGRSVRRRGKGSAYEARALSRREKTAVCLTGSKPTLRYRSLDAGLSGLKHILIRTAPAAASRSMPTPSR